jgi:hypothetical protein
MTYQSRKSIFIINLLNRLQLNGTVSGAAHYVIFRSKAQSVSFGKYNTKEFTVNIEGRIITKAWKEIQVKFPKCTPGAFAIGHDWFSGIIIIDKSLSKYKQDRLYFRILTYFKNRTTELLNKLHGTHGRFIWENNYDEVAISDISSLKKIITYMNKST